MIKFLSQSKAMEISFFEPNTECIDALRSVMENEVTLNDIHFLRKVVAVENKTSKRMQV